MLNKNNRNIYYSGIKSRKNGIYSEKEFLRLAKKEFKKFKSKKCKKNKACKTRKNLSKKLYKNKKVEINKYLKAIKECDKCIKSNKCNLKEYVKYAGASYKYN